MKLTATLPLIFALSVSSLAFAQSGDMKGRDMNGVKSMDMKGMKDMDMKKCMEIKGMKDLDMKGMDMQDMDAQKCKDMMKNMAKKQTSDSKATAHKADAVVKEVDAANGKVILAHEAVKNLGWPAMTMAFAVKDKRLLDKLVAGKKVHVEFSKQDSGYVITSVK